eukprot:1182903-Prorocentrum_minimum.AAC.1
MPPFCVRLVGRPVTREGDFAALQRQVLPPHLRRTNRTLKEGIYPQHQPIARCAATVRTGPRLYAFLTPHLHPPGVRDVRDVTRTTHVVTASPATPSKWTSSPPPSTRRRRYRLAAAVVYFVGSPMSAHDDPCQGLPSAKESDLNTRKHPHVMHRRLLDSTA